MPDNELTRRGAGNNSFLRNGHDGSSMIPELAAQYAARASGAAISKTTIKKITLVLNRRTQRRERAILFCRRFSIRARTQTHVAKKKPRSPKGTRLQYDTRPS